jgi:hypothetical protein
MNIQKIIDTERAIDRLEARLAGMLEPGMCEALQIARQWVAEVRHFAVCWSEAPAAGAAIAAAHNVEPSEGLRIARGAYIDRLVQTFRPE